MMRIRHNSPAEEASIQRGIAADADAAEWTEQDFAQVYRAVDVLPTSMLAPLTPRRQGAGVQSIRPRRK